MKCSAPSRRIRTCSRSARPAAEEAARGRGGKQQRRGAGQRPAVPRVGRQAERRLDPGPGIGKVIAGEREQILPAPRQMAGEQRLLLLVDMPGKDVGDDQVEPASGKAVRRLGLVALDRLARLGELGVLVIERLAEGGLGLLCLVERGLRVLPALPARPRSASTLTIAAPRSADDIRSSRNVAPIWCSSSWICVAIAPSISAAAGCNAPARFQLNAARKSAAARRRPSMIQSCKVHAISKGNRLVDGGENNAKERTGRAILGVVPWGERPI